MAGVALFIGVFLPISLLIGVAAAAIGFTAWGLVYT